MTMDGKAISDVSPYQEEGSLRMEAGRKRLGKVAAFVAAGCVSVLIVASLAGCGGSPQNDGVRDSGTTGGTSGQTVVDGAAFAWSPDADCTGCHTSEAASQQDPSCQAARHADLPCGQCHTEAAVLADAHEGVKVGDRMPKKASMETVDQQTCVDCHGTYADLALRTASSTALTDQNGTVVNPHAVPSNAKHDANITCMSCHTMHAPMDAGKFCTSCHHRGIYECGTCHALKE